jgi:hypothetical protein
MRAIVNYRVNTHELAEAKAYAEKHHLPRLVGLENQRDRAEVLRYRMAQNNCYVQLDICLKNGISAEKWAEILLYKVSYLKIDSTTSREMWKAIDILTVTKARWFIKQFCA